MTLTHPIGDKSLLKVSKQSLLANGNFKITFREEETESFFPNLVAVPCTDYSLTVAVGEVGKKHNQHKFTKYFPLKLYKKGGRGTAASEDVTVDFEIINDTQIIKETV